MALRGAHQRGPRLLAPAAALLALAVAGTAPATARATLLVDHVQANAAVDGGGLMGPGKSFTLDETINNSELSLTGVSGQLTSTPGVVSLDRDASPYPDLGFGEQGTNTTHFHGTVDPSAECGTTLPFTLHVHADQGDQDVPFTVPTGIPGPPSSYAASDLPRPIPDGGNISSNLDVTGGGLAKGITVRLGQIDHTYDGDLKIELVAPDNTSVVLVNQRGGSGHNYTNTTFSDSASQSITTASAPFTGTYRPEQPLSTFDGHPINGTWHLKVSDEQLGDTGVIQAWGADIRPAVCTTQPVASFTASPSPAPPSSSVAFDASSSVEPKNGATITSYEWDWDGDGTYDQTTSTPTVSHTFTTRGQHTIGLRVTDDAGESGTTTRSLIVTQPPTVSLAASPNPVEAGSPVTLNATATDPDPGGSITKYEWDLNGDGSFETDTGAVSATSTTFASAGTYTVHVRVTDSDGATAVATTTVTVDPPSTTNQPPVASLSLPSTAVVNQPVTLDASGSSDPDGTVTQYEWDFNGDGTYDQTTTQPTVSHTFTAAGQVTIGLRVTDDGGATDATTAKLNVVLPPQPGSLSASMPNPVPLNTPITFTDTGANDPNAGGSITRYEWDLDGDGSFETDTGTTPSASHAYATNGTRTVRVRVTEASGATAVATYTLVAANQPPVISSLTASPNPVTVGQPVTFTAAASDPEGHGIARYDWDLDGNGGYETPSGSSPTISFAYPNAGPISVGVRVTDVDGGQSVATVSLQVNPGAGGEGVGATNSAGPGAGSPLGGGPSGGGAPPLPKSLRAGLLGAVIQRGRTVRSRGLTVTCRTDRPATCALSLEVSARVARRYGVRTRRNVVIGTASGTATAGRDASLAVRLNATGRRLVAHARTLSLLVRATVRDFQGGRAALVRAVVVRR